LSARPQMETSGDAGRTRLGETRHGDTVRPRKRNPNQPTNSAPEGPDRSDAVIDYLNRSYLDPDAERWQSSAVDLDPSAPYACGLADGVARGLEVAQEILARVRPGVSNETSQRLDRPPSVLGHVDQDAATIARAILGPFGPPSSPKAARARGSRPPRGASRCSLHPPTERSYTTSWDLTSFCARFAGGITRPERALCTPAKDCFRVRWMHR
jgi:hypothetical protein